MVVFCLFSMGETFPILWSTYFGARLSNRPNWKGERQWHIEKVEREWRRGLVEDRQQEGDDMGKSDAGKCARSVSVHI